MLPFKFISIKVVRTVWKLLLHFLPKLNNYLLLPNLINSSFSYMCVHMCIGVYVASGTQFMYLKFCPLRFCMDTFFLNSALNYEMADSIKLFHGKKQLNKYSFYQCVSFLFWISFVSQKLEIQIWKSKLPWPLMPK